MEAAALARSKNKAAKQGRTIVFIDESGLSQRPHRCRTWAPRGQTPMLQFHFNWKKLSAVAGVTWWNFYFRLFPGAIRAPQVVEFLRHLQQHLPGKLLVVWDGLQSHRSRLVRQYVERQQGRLVLEFLPAYAPELNPVEYLWGYWKQHELPNFCPKAMRNSVATPGAPCDGCSGVPILSRRFGNKRNCSRIVTILCDSQ